MNRTTTILAILATVLSGSGLPMCVSLLARAVEPCAMHQHEQAGHAAHGAQVAASHADDSCHPGDGNTGCATGGACPTGGTAAPVAHAGLSTPRAALDSTPVLDQPYPSFLSPPLSPPPQV